MDFATEDILKVLLAVAVGGVIGAEREYRDKAAGFRTIIFICVGATLFTLFSLKIGGDEDAARIAAQIVTGVGFLGAGAIMRDAGRVMGLTTAATIWLAAALGMGIGGGYYIFTLSVALVVLFVLFLFPKIEHLIDNVRDFRTYQVVAAMNPALFDELDTLFHESGLHIQERRHIKTGDDMICSWHVYGSPRNHAQMIDRLFTHPDVKSFNV